MRNLTALVVLLALALSTLGLVRSSGGPNDGGLGRDASDAVSSPSALPGFGSYAGALDENDADWFSVANGTASTGAFCFEADASADGGSTVTLGLRGAGFDHAVTIPTSLDASAPTRIVLAGDAVDLAYVGFVPSTTRDVGYAFTVGGSTGAASNASLAPTPAGLLASPMPLPGPCTSGTLDPAGGAGHTTDAYSFAGEAGQQVVYSLGATVPTVTAQLVDSGFHAAGPAIGPDGVANVTLPQAGTYYLVASQSSATSPVQYLLGVLGQGSYPCQPFCAVSS